MNGLSHYFLWLHSHNSLSRHITNFSPEHIAQSHSRIGTTIFFRSGSTYFCMLQDHRWQPSDQIFDLISSVSHSFSHSSCNELSLPTNTYRAVSYSYEHVDKVTIRSSEEQVSGEEKVDLFLASWIYSYNSSCDINSLYASESEGVT